MIDSPALDPRPNLHPEEAARRAPWVDEDAFGVLFSYCEVETDEYGQDEAEFFVGRFLGFERAVLELARSLELANDHHAVCLGHAIYIEFRDCEPGAELLRKVRRAAAELTERGYVNVTALTHGVRWVPEGGDPLISVSGDGPRLVQLSRPSEPLRRALDLETLARPDETGHGFGPGMYVDVEALEALGRTPKNAPTVFSVKGADFYRLPPVPLERS